jgi:glycosyltransferase involved in cell wall biosynthesis
MTVGNVLIPLLARRLGLDVVHDLTGVTPLLGVGDSTRTVVTVHDVFAWSCPGHSTWLDALIYRYWLPHVLPRVDAVITVSQASKADIVRYLKLSPTKIHVAYPGVDAAFRPLPEAQVARVRRRYGLPDRYILFVGSVEKRKNLTGLLRAYACLSNMEQASMPLVIVGARRRAYIQMPGAREIEATLQNLGLERDVVFTGYVPDVDLPALYNGATLFVFPSLYEGFGLPPLEAMACGTPVVCSNVASLPEVVGDSGASVADASEASGAPAALTVDPYDIEGLADAMRRVIVDNDLQEDLRRRGLARAQRFTWAKTARKVVDVYQHLLVASAALVAPAASDPPASAVQQVVRSQKS